MTNEGMGDSTADASSVLWPLKAEADPSKGQREDSFGELNAVEVRNPDILEWISNQKSNSPRLQLADYVDRRG